MPDFGPRGQQVLLLPAGVECEKTVIEHVVSRPAGGNGYRNVVAACRQYNNRKGDSDAEDFLRILYAKGFSPVTSSSSESRTYSVFGQESCFPPLRNPQEPRKKSEIDIDGRSQHMRPQRIRMCPS